MCRVKSKTTTDTSLVACSTSRETLQTQPPQTMIGSLTTLWTPDLMVTQRTG
jgi:hypothetical protein